MTPWHTLIPKRPPKPRHRYDHTMPDRFTTLAWAVALGACTPTRLAAEWGIDRSNALRKLQTAERAGYLIPAPHKPRRGPMGYRYRIADELAAEWSLEPGNEQT